MPEPWLEVKSNRGRKKTISTQYQFCSHPDCKYYLIADGKILDPHRIDYLKQHFIQIHLAIQNGVGYSRRYGG
jgi:beta-glucosidase/6-phospho-beta-glucosidase/beta-galactosidase